VGLDGVVQIEMKSPLRRNKQQSQNPRPICHDLHRNSALRRHAVPSAASPGRLLREGRVETKVRPSRFGAASCRNNAAHRSHLFRAAHCQEGKTNREYRPVEGGSPIHPEGCVRSRIAAREPHGQHKCAAEDAGYAREQADHQRYADQEFATAHGEGRGSGCMSQNLAEHRNHEWVRSAANESLNIVTKSGAHESGTEDLVLAEDDKEEPNSDAQQGKHHRISIYLLFECRRVATDVRHRVSPVTWLPPNSLDAFKTLGSL
jgi:hypothetical protein